jgi:hypothetical protein
VKGSEKRLAHFLHRWEAEFAQGFLEDAGIPGRVVDDGLVGTSAYTGDHSGMSLFVTIDDEKRARETLEAAGVLESPEAVRKRGLPLVERELPPVLRADAEDLTQRLRLARRKETRHGIYALLGFTPAALIPFVGLFLEGNLGLVAVLFVLVVFVEGWKWIRAGKEVKQLEALLQALEAEADVGEGPLDSLPPNRPIGLPGVGE